MMQAASSKPIMFVPGKLIMKALSILVVTASLFCAGCSFEPDVLTVNPGDEVATFDVGGL